MSPCIPNTKGSDSPADVPYGAWNSFPRTPFPEYAGSKLLLYCSAGGKIVRLGVAVGCALEVILHTFVSQQPGLMGFVCTSAGF